MKKESESMVELTTRFYAVGYDLVRRIRDEFKEDLAVYKGVTVPVISGEGPAHLMLDTDGEWSSVFGMGGHSLGKLPPMNLLLTEYAIIADKGYQDIVFSESDRTAAYEEGDRYVQKNKEKLLSGLVKTMERKLAILQGKSVLT
jgi:hypothetical protein